MADIPVCHPAGRCYATLKNVPNVFFMMDREAAGRQWIDIVANQFRLQFRRMRRVLTSGFGWTVMPVYLCQDLLDAGELAIIPPPVGTTQLDHYLAWVPGARRHPRLAHAQ
ncbi:hypothetical protein [Pectobacterium sp. B2J-2]|uniref:hypothetical protein n=1 Tax=Pectobacterium sp. B2J-2 TaxID=3385372 RepID=UPI0038FCEE57